MTLLGEDPVAPPSPSLVVVALEVCPQGHRATTASEMLGSVFFIIIPPLGLSGPGARFFPPPEMGSGLPLYLFECKGWIGRLWQFKFDIRPMAQRLRDWAMADGSGRKAGRLH